MLLVVLLLTLAAVLAGLVLVVQKRRRATFAAMKADTARRLAADPWRLSAERVETPSADDLYRSSGFDKDDTRIEDSPRPDDRGPGEPRD